jgi:DnaJ-class molecular chaperone
MSNNDNTDEVPPDSSQSGENTCRKCSGTGMVEGQPCSECDGTGIVNVLVGDA